MWIIRISLLKLQALKFLGELNPELLIKSQSPQSNISDLAPKLVRTIAGKSYNCGQIEDK